MEEELSENELEERFYSMLHYVDDTHTSDVPSENALAVIENAPKSTVRRYWRTSGDSANQRNNAYQKVNSPIETPNKPATTDKTKPKEEKNVPPEPEPVQLPLIFQSPVPQNIKNTIEIIEHEVCNVVELESSDEDEVIEVKLPSKPTITIESSDEDELTNKPKAIKTSVNIEKPYNNDREICASPVLSVVSSICDEFIRGDCIALNISSRKSVDHSFDFSLHGADLLDQSTPSKKKKKKKSMDMTSTPIAVLTTPEKPVSNSGDYFATPKSKAKNKKQKTKSFTVSKQSIPSADVYDSDSNQSVDTITKGSNPYTVTDKSLPSVDVYESDSNQSKTVKEPVKSNQTVSNNDNVNNSDNFVEKPQKKSPEIPKKVSNAQTDVSIIDLTDNFITLDDSDIPENIVIGKLTGFTEPDDYDDTPTPQHEVTKYCSSKVPAILNANLDFDNLKGKDMVCKNRRFSLTTLRAEMEKFYNESWGGEEFNHREIQKHMSRDKSLWEIDPKDKMPSVYRKKPTCNYCNRVGHRDVACRARPPVCHMCGAPGHCEPRCPTKICVNCGSSNNMYSTMCRHCCAWGRLSCAECGQPGHPASHCPDLWRRYHSTIDITNNLEQNYYTKKHHQQFCSACTRRGHLAHTCRLSIPFSGLPINSPYVYIYNPLYNPMDYQINRPNNTKKIIWPHSLRDSPVTDETQFRSDRNKRLSKSPIVHDTHVNKKRTLVPADISEVQRHKSPINTSQLKTPQREAAEDRDKVTENVPVASENVDANKAPDFIPIGSATNRDKKEQIIQDNEVSDTSAVVTSSRIYVTDYMIEALKTKEGYDWLKATMQKFNVVVENKQSFLSVKGTFADQESFQSTLIDWYQSKTVKEHEKSDNEADVTLESENDQSVTSHDIPKNRNLVLQKLGKALDSLKEDLGEPNALYKELTYLQNNHAKLLKEKVVHPKRLSNNRYHINEVFKKLNAILLGQAGLADGSKHVSKLYSLQEKLMNINQKNVSKELRNEIGLHFHTIFSAVPREDYMALLKTYYKDKKGKSYNNKKKFKPIPQLNFNDHVNPNNCLLTLGLPPGQKKKHLTQITRNKLIFMHRRILNARTSDSVMKKMKVKLLRKLHSHIASLYTDETMTTKNVKKIKKVQEQAQTFLSNYS